MKRLRASSLIRTLVVASATLAILLVCFSIYQYSQLDPSAEGPDSSPRLPPMPTASTTESDLGQTRSVASVGSTPIGTGRNVKLTVYEPEGTRAQFEIAVSSYAPIEGTLNEFLLIDPEIRLRTNGGNAVRVTADQGVVEAQSKAGGGLVPLRGRLKGKVLIELDRLTDQDRRKLPEMMRNVLDESDILRISMDEIVFDRESSKLSVNGEVRLSARDVDFVAREVEIRFDEAGGRVEYLRTAGGGRIELREVAGSPHLSLPSMDGGTKQRTTVVEWISSSLQARLKTAVTSAAANPPLEPAAKETAADDGIPVFRSDSSKGGSTRNPGRYWARFEDQVVAKQVAGNEVQARLEASLLEILRQVGDEDRDRATAQPHAPGIPAAEPAENPPSAGGNVVLEWAGRLNVEAMTPTDPRWVDGVGSLVTATGTPARIINNDGQASCAQLRFEPDSAKVTLHASERHPVIVDTPGQEQLQGQVVQYTQIDERIEVLVSGPGSFRQKNDSTLPGPRQSGGHETAEISFVDSLVLRGGYENAVSVRLTRGIVAQRRRRFDEAVFKGGVRVARQSASLSTDELTARFGPAAHSERQIIERIIGRGNVMLSDGADSLSASEVDVELVTDSFGRALPVQVTARGGVAANQGERTLRARERLIVDFETVSRVASVPPETPSGSAQALEPNSAGNRGLAAPKFGMRSDAAASRLRATGAVSVVDPTQALDVVAEELDCTIREGKDISSVFLKGLVNRPASAQLKTLSVAGTEIKMQVADEWAEVPGPGRMTFRSQKDLDGRRVEQPMPVAVTWTERMKYQGRENRAFFFGGVHAATETGTTFDTEQLEVEFEDAPAKASAPSPSKEWSIVSAFAGRWFGKRTAPSEGPRLPGSSKQVASLLATGRVVAVTAEANAQSGQLESRVSIRGPRLALNLRDEVSKMTIEGPGSLTLEDYRENTKPPPASPTSPSDGLFMATAESGRSATLIEWRELMWYDFSIQQTRFEGDVVFKHFSGAELAQLVRLPAVDGPANAGGTRTFVTCDVLAADFQQRQGRTASNSEPRMGRLGADRLRQFHARGNVALQAPSHHLFLTADSVTFEKDRSLLAVLGSQTRAARILIQKPREYPQDLSAERFFFNLATNSVEFAEPAFKRH